MRHLLLASALLVVPTLNAAAFEYEAYKSAELAAVVPTVEPIPSARLHMYLDAAHPRYRTIARFTGQVRELSDERQTLIRYWVKAMGHPTEYELMFKKEIEVVQNGRAWWLPIQSSLTADFVQEVAAGTKVELFVLFIGTVNLDPVFSISEFEARPNHSLNRTHCGVPPFVPPFHSGPNAVTPQCAG